MPWWERRKGADPAPRWAFRARPVLAVAARPPGWPPARCPVTRPPGPGYHSVFLTSARTNYRTLRELSRARARRRGSRADAVPVELDRFGRQRRPAQDQVGGLLRDHHHRGVDVA